MYNIIEEERRNDCMFSIGDKVKLISGSLNESASDVTYTVTGALIGVVEISDSNGTKKTVLERDVVKVD